MSVFKKFAGQTFIYGVSTIFAKLFNFILTPFYTRVFSKSVYGVFTNLYANASLINTILAFGMETSFFRYINKHEDQKKQVLNNAFWFVFILSTVFLILGLCLNTQITHFYFNGQQDFENRKFYVKLIVWISYLDALSIIPFVRLRADGHPIWFGLVRMTNIFAFLGLNMVFLWFLPKAIAYHWIAIPSWYHGPWVGYVLISNVVASAITFLMLLPQLKGITFEIDKKMLVSMLGYSFPVLVANISFIINENIDKIMMPKLLPSSIAEYDLGIYGACAKIAVFLNIMNQAYRLGAEPFFFSYAKNEDAPKTYARLMDLFVIAVAIIFVAIIANISWIQLFIGESYRVGLWVVPLLLMGYMCLGVYMNLSVWYRLSDQTRYGVYISSIGAVLTIVLNILLIPKYSYMAAAAVSFLAYFVMMSVSYFWGQKHYPIPYKVGRNMSVMLVAVGLGMVSFWGFNQNVWLGNILLITFVVALLYTEKEMIKKILKK